MSLQFAVALTTAEGRIDNGNGERVLTAIFSRNHSRALRLLLRNGRGIRDF